MKNSSIRSKLAAQQEMPLAYRQTKETLARLFKRLASRILGQVEVLQLLIEEILRRETNAVPQPGARGCFVLAGPTGVGKTFTVEELALALFGPDRYARFDCSEHGEGGVLKVLLGDRSGDRGLLGQVYDQVSEGIWLWDEFEKADPALIRLFLQMTRPGRVTLACGEVLDLHRIYLFVTTNLGSAEILECDQLNFTSLETHVKRCIEEFLSPELRGRFGEPLVFRPLGLVIIHDIARLKLDELMAWEREQGREITYEPEVINFVVQRGFSPRLGARPLQDFLNKSVGNAIVENEMAGGNGSGRLVVSGERLKLVS